MLGSRRWRRPSRSAFPRSTATPTHGLRRGADASATPLLAQARRPPSVEALAPARLRQSDQRRAGAVGGRPGAERSPSTPEPSAPGCCTSWATMTRSSRSCRSVTPASGSRTLPGHASIHSLSAVRRAGRCSSRISPMRSWQLPSTPEQRRRRPSVTSTAGGWVGSSTRSVTSGRSGIRQLGGRRTDSTSRRAERRRRASVDTEGVEQFVDVGEGDRLWAWDAGPVDATPLL